MLLIQEDEPNEVGSPPRHPGRITEHDWLFQGKKNKQKTNLHGEGEGRQMLLAWALPPVRHVCAPAGPEPQLEQVWAVPGSPSPRPAR